MLKPSYTELMDVLNEVADMDTKITSRYSIVIATAKRARQIIDGEPCNPQGAPSNKALSIAINEMYNKNIRIYPEGMPQEEMESAEGIAIHDEVLLDEEIELAALDAAEDEGEDLDKE